MTSIRRRLERVEKQAGVVALAAGERDPLLVELLRYIDSSGEFNIETVPCGVSAADVTARLMRELKALGPEACKLPLCHRAA